MESLLEILDLLYDLPLLMQLDPDLQAELLSFTASDVAVSKIKSIEVTGRFNDAKGRFLAEGPAITRLRPIIEYRMLYLCALNSPTELSAYAKGGPVIFDILKTTGVLRGQTAYLAKLLVTITQENLKTSIIEVVFPK